MTGAWPEAIAVELITEDEPPARASLAVASATGNEVFVHGPVAAHCMIALNPNVPSCKLIWSLSCTVNAPSMSPATNAIVTMV